MRPTIHTKHPRAKVKTLLGVGGGGGGGGGGAKVPSGSVALALHLLVRNDLVNKIEFLAPLTKWTNGIGVMYIALCLQQYIIFSLSYRKKKKRYLVTSISQHLLSGCGPNV